MVSELWAVTTKSPGVYDICSAQEENRKFSRPRGWQKSMDLVAECYQLARSLPSHEQYGLASQLRRAAVSIPSNIAEGFGRWHSKEFVHFLLVATAISKSLRRTFSSESV